PIADALEPAAPAAERPTRRTAYRAAELPAVGRASDDFYAPANTGLVRDQIATVVREEGPISRALLVKRVLQAWGIARSGARIERRFDEVAGGLALRATEGDGTVFYWPDGVEPAEYGVFRVSEGELERRNAEDLPPEEVASAVKETLFLHGSLPVEDLIRETVKLLGYSRTGSALDKALRSGLQAAVGRGDADLENGRAHYRKG
ncbi:DUF3320 domain-containing protein, partial [Paenibacillus sp. MWE-103]